MTRLFTFLLVSITACAELDPPTLIERDRVLGAKVTVDTDPERAWPAPGERATVTWLTASPGAPATFSWILTACPAATSEGMPVCAGPAIATARMAGPVPILELEVPADIATPSIAVAGAICATGEPVLDPATAIAACSDGSRADVVSQHIFLATEGSANKNPNLAGAPLTFAGADWAIGDCPSIDAGSKRALVGVSFAASDRELYVDNLGAQTREELQLAAFATSGEIIQQHTYVDPADDREVAQVAFEWEPPAKGELVAGAAVEFFLVVRDLRGGVDMTSRTLCVR